MKRIWSVCLLLMGMAFSVSAQSFYFDIGIGFGWPTTKIDGNDLSDILSGSKVTDIGVDLGLKAGYGPFGEIPLYAVGEFAGMGHRFQTSDNYMQFNSYIIGAGLIFYPIPLIQLAGTIGFSYAADQTDLQDVVLPASERGVAWDLSAAFDFGKRNSGFLLGLRYFGSSNTLTSNEKQDSSIISVFVRYAFRHKIQQE
ncbi:hypothetical protein AGMMS50267_01070 [Spirochaetia bacterium]|nr:hypothetical protein AGMMS50267_01070 [Spirochaetia bacterium]